MKEQIINTKNIINDCIIYVRKYFSFHDATVLLIDELINIMINNECIPMDMINQKDELHILVKNELKYEFLRIYESLNSTLKDINKSLKKLVQIKKQIQDYTIHNKLGILNMLQNFLKKTLIYFKQDYKLKRTLYHGMIHIDKNSDDEINRLKLIWKETPFLYLIIQKFHLNKIITECSQFLNKT
ncbi:conserved Plasmodium protein, unknown function [Plasmodium sp. gorilla clade G3]|nr:conserved Plasmodium protein, unknown function [Plasmodium sp. gorilla clade G3]